MLQSSFPKRQGLCPAKDMSAVSVAGMRMHMQEALPEQMVLSATSCHYQRTLHALAPADCSQQRTADRTRLLCFASIPHAA
jgi:hypothetical protein